MAIAIAFETGTSARQGGGARGGNTEGGGGAFAAMLSQDGGGQSKGQHAEGQRSTPPTSGAAGLRALHSLLQDHGEPQDARALEQVLDALRNGEVPPQAALQTLLGDEDETAALERLAALLAPEEISPELARALDIDGPDRAAAREALDDAQSDARAALQALLAVAGRESAAGADGQRSPAAEAPRGSAGAEAGRLGARAGAPVEGDLRIDSRSLERMTQDNRGADGRFFGQKVTVNEQGAAQTPQGRLSGETALAAQSSVQQAAAALKGQGEATRNSQLRQAGSARSETQQGQSAPLQNAQNHTTQAQPLQPQTAQPQAAQAQATDQVQEQAQLRTSAQARADDAAEARQSVPRGGEAEAAGRSAGGEGRAASPGQSFDPVIQNNQTTANANAQPNAAPAQNHAAQQAAQHRPTGHAPLQDQIAVKIQRAAQDGQQRVNIRLNPAELGRIDVKLEMSDDGRVRAVLSVERPETLDMLQRDARGLERALHDAGLKTDGGSLSFDLEGGSEHRDGERDHAEGGGSTPQHQEDTNAGLEAPLPDNAEDVPSPLRLIEDGLDIRV